MGKAHNGGVGRALVPRARIFRRRETGGPGRVRTDDLFHAMEARSQLRHRPARLIFAYLLPIVKRMHLIHTLLLVILGQFTTALKISILTEGS